MISILQVFPKNYHNVLVNTNIYCTGYMYRQKPKIYKLVLLVSSILTLSSVVELRKKQRNMRFAYSILSRYLKKLHLMFEK